MQKQHPVWFGNNRNSTRRLPIILILFISAFALLITNINAQAHKKLPNSQTKSWYTDHLFSSISRNSKGHITNSEPFEKNLLDSLNFDTETIAFGDIDGDGDLDLALGNEDTANQIYINDSTGIFAELPNALGEVNRVTKDIAWGDMDGDGDLDLAVANWGETNSRNQIFENLGNRQFSELNNALLDTNENSYSIAWGDVDGDGDLDLAVGNAGFNRLYRNIDNGSFEEIENAFPIYGYDTISVAWGDVDDDGDLDLAVGNLNQRNQVFENVGDGTFNDLGSIIGIEEYPTRIVSWGDIDGDNDLDLVVGNDEFANQLFENLGNGQFSVKNVTLDNNNDKTTSIAIGDYDNDGDLDIAIGNTGASLEGVKSRNRLYSNDGEGNFVEAIGALGLDTRSTHGIAWGDIDGDKDLDLIVGNHDFNQVHKNQGSVGFSNSTIDLDIGPNSVSYSVNWGDIDGDNDLDLVVGNHGSQSQVFTNLGNGTFIELMNALEGTSGSNTSEIALGDMDGDGDLDLAIGNTNRNNQIYENLGNGVFIEQFDRFIGDSPSGTQTQSIAWGDMDGDGDLDLAIGNGNFGLEIRYQNQIYENLGDGRFQEVPNALGSEKQGTFALAWGDMDNDGDLDLAVGNRYAVNRLYRNLGGGVFSEVIGAFGDSLEDTKGLAWGDMDGDGDLDLAIANDAGINRIYENQGNGRFVDQVGILGVTAGASWSVTWGDMDNDGDLDLAIGNRETSNQLFENIGGGRFREINNAFSNLNEDTRGLAWGDMDNDGDLDLALTNVNGFLNQDTPVVRIHKNTQSKQITSSSDSLIIAAHPPDQSVTNFYSQSQIWSDRVIPLRYELENFEAGGGGYIQGYYSINGGGQWLPAVATTDTITTHLLSTYGPFNGLVSYWALDEGLGSLTYDYAHGSSTGTFFNAPTWITSTPEPLSNSSKQAISLDGIDDYLSFDNAKTLSPPWTVSSWVQRKPGNNLSVFLNGTSFATKLIQPNTGQVGVTHYSVADYSFDYVVPIDEWVHLTFRATTTQTQLYVNGQLKDTLDISIPLQYSLLGTRVGGSDYLKAYVDDIRIYERAVLPEEIKLLANPVHDNYFYWDTFASGFFGRSDNVLFRLVAYPQPKNETTDGIYSYTNVAPGKIQQAYVATSTYPFRVRGTQVQVFDEELTSNQEALGAIVHKQSGEGRVQPIGDSTGLPFVTDSNGFLPGRGILERGDKLFAMLPISTTYRTQPQLLFGGLDGLGAVQLTEPPTTSFTAEFWLRPFSDEGIILTDGSTFTLTNPANLELNLNDTTTQTDINLNDGAIHHVALTWDNSNGRWQLIIDNDEALTRSGTAAAGQMLDMNTLTIGEGYNGFIDEIRLWNGLRTAEQIAANFNQPLTGNETGLIGYWPIEEEDVNRVQDHSGNDQTMTVSGGALLIYKPLYTLYHTSAQPTENGLALQEVTEPGVQQLVVSKDNPLALFDLTVSLEWDASNDPIFLDQLDNALKQASATLYDVTNGQMALGNVVVYQNKERWLTADVAIQANSGVRPSAAIGGVVSVPQNDVDKNGDPIENAFVPGQIRMGPNWNPFGQATGDLGQEWWQAFAHELGHYLLFLPDNYLGIEDNLLITTDCFGSFMTNSSNSEYSEFLTESAWQTANCQRTLAEQTTGRYDWETLTEFYPFLQEPPPTNSGPGTLPLAVTNVIIKQPDQNFDDDQNNDLNTLPARIFELRDTNNSLVSVVGGQGYLLKQVGESETDRRLIQLGNVNATGQFLQVRGAEVGDRLCVIGAGDPVQIGCEEITAVGSTVTMYEVDDWRPQITITPLSATEIQIEVTQSFAGSGDLNFQLLPVFEPISPTILAPLERVSYTQGVDQYSATLTADYPIFAGSVRVWVDGTPPREAIIPYTLGEGFDADQFLFGADQFLFGADQFLFGADQFLFGADQFLFGADQFLFGADQFLFGADQFLFGADQFLFGADQFLFGADQFLFGNNEYTMDANRRPWGAPVSSPNREVTVINRQDVFGETGVKAIQELTNIPAFPAWLAPVGAGYRVSTVTDGEPLQRAITFQYLTDAVPAGYEQSDLMDIYYSSDGGATWETLETTIDEDENYAIATMPDAAEGIYVLAVTVQVATLLEAGWNLFNFPLPAGQSVEAGLVAVDGKYAAVVNYDPLTDRWQTYFTDVVSPFEPLVNDLQSLRYTYFYQIYMREAAPLFFNPADSLMRSTTAMNFPTPPAVFYGGVEPAAGFTPQVGDAVVALIDGQECGRGEIMALPNVLSGTAPPPLLDYTIYLPYLQNTPEIGYKLVVESDNGNGCGAPGRVVQILVNGQLIHNHPWINNYEACYLPLGLAGGVSCPAAE